jgi:hypothetical protein
MILTLAGVMTSFCAGMMIFLIDKRSAGRLTIGVFSSAVGVFVLCAITAVASSFLRVKYPMSDKSQFIGDLLHIYPNELRLQRWAAAFACVGLFVLAVGVLLIGYGWHATIVSWLHLTPMSAVNVVDPDWDCSPLVHLPSSES